MIRITVLLAFCLLVAGLAEAQPKKLSVLLYTSPDRWHDQALPAAIPQLEKLAEAHFFDLTWTQQEASFSDAVLREHAVVVFLNANGERFSPAQWESLRRFIRAGGGFVGIHAAAVAAEREQWYQRLVGRVFTGHPEKQAAVITVRDFGFPATMHLPEHWVWTDEWYEFGPALTANQHVLLNVDETTYVAKRTTEQGVVEGMGPEHPVAWYQEYDGGRSFYTALGHLRAHYDDPWFLRHIYGGIYWAATGRGVVR